MPTANFTQPGVYGTWPIPARVEEVTVTLEGAGSGARAGGRVTGKLKVAGLSQLVIVVGEAGKGFTGTTGGVATWGGGGRGGNGAGHSGGASGGGYSAIRRNSASGSIAAVAGGAGGSSGDGGVGGLGGGTTAGPGSRGTSGTNATANATGGTQSQGGNGGTSGAGTGFAGVNAADSVLATGGAGGSDAAPSFGGGGGGGGYHGGGGGNAAAFNFAPGGGGGGGSSYIGGLTQAVIGTPGNGSTGDGSVVITWVTPAPANQPPSPPSTVRINGVDEAEELPTKADRVTISAELNDPDLNNTRMLVRVSANKFASHLDFYSGYVASGHRASVTFDVTPGYLYRAQVYAQDSHGLFSTSYNGISFWSDRAPTAPTLLLPKENSRIPAASSTIFTWTHNDPDPTDPQRGFEFRYRAAATPTRVAGAWVTISQPTNPTSTWTLNPGTFRGNNTYEWSVRTKDVLGIWGVWATPASLFASSTSTPPILLTPRSGLAVDVNVANTFTWRFVDPDPGDSQTRADFRYRIFGQDDTQWITLVGAVTPGVPGSAQAWTHPAGTFAAGVHYEWAVRTYDALGGLASDWSFSAHFWAIDTPGIGNIPPPVDVSDIPQGSLGCGTYRAYIYDQGGRREVGQIAPTTSVQFKRVRDDISDCSVTSNGFGPDCCALYADVHCWIHELVIFRDDVRVWEGPITRIAYHVDHVEFEAKDVMAYLYRRILRQGFDDSYQKVAGQTVGSPTVVDRASRIIVDALAPYDPNVLPYLTVFESPGDAKESRVVPDYSTTAWEAVDNLAATAGLDYTVVGRRIILWDTHRRIGRLPEMRDGDFSDPPVVTEYGMQLSNYFAVTNGSGVWGSASPQGQTSPFQSYGPIEMLASAYGEAAGGGDDVLTSAARQDLVEKLESQAERNINDRWPTPVIVRVPDNSTLSPDAEVGFDQLIPGVWVLLRSSATCREVEQWQKLDSVTVVYESGLEKVQVVMSPAPNGGQDPDATEEAAAAAAVITVLQERR